MWKEVVSTQLYAYSRESVSMPGRDCGYSFGFRANSESSKKTKSHIDPLSRRMIRPVTWGDIVSPHRKEGSRRTHHDNEIAYRAGPKLEEIILISTQELLEEGRHTTQRQVERSAIQPPAETLFQCKRNNPCDDPLTDGANDWSK